MDMITIIIISIIFLALLLMLGSCIFKVEDGKNAVIVRSGRIIKSIGPGSHIKMPWEYYYKMPGTRLVYPPNEKILATIPTKDGVPINIEGIVHYLIKDPALFVKNYMIGEHQKEFWQYGHGEQLKSQLIAALRSEINPKEFANIFGGISVDTLKEKMSPTMKDFGIEVVDVTIEKIEPPKEFQETARKLIEQKTRTQYLKSLSDVVKEDSDKLIELVYLESSDDKSLPVREKITKKRLAEAESSSYKRLEDELGPEIAKKVRELQALEKKEDIILKIYDFTK